MSLLRKPKTKAGLRELEKRQPVDNEGAKTCVFLKGTSTSQIVSNALKDLALLKKPDCVTFSKRNEIHPFDDHKQLEFFSQKNDAALFVFGSHSKKRPHNLVFARMYEHQLLDMFELGIESFKGIDEFKGEKPAIGNRPLILFQGEHWEATEETKTIKSIFLDLYTGDTSTEMLDLTGLSHAIVFTLSGTLGTALKISMKTHQIVLKKSGLAIPRVELVEIGPSIDFVQRRCTLATPDMMKDAMKMPKLGKQKKQKNVETNEFGETTGRVWMEPQDLSKLQTRKMKGLKRRAEENNEESEQSDEQ